MSERSTCAHCGKPIVLGPWFLNGRLPNPSIWTHVGSGRTCASRAKKWNRSDWPCAEPSMREAADTPQGEISAESAMLAAQAHEVALRDLSARLRTAGYAYAANSAYVAAEASLSIVEDLQGAVPKHPASGVEAGT